VIAGVLACFLITAALARRASRRVSEPIAWLEGAAAAVGAGQQVKAEPLGIAELDGLAAALARAAHERTQAQRERDALLSRVTESLNSAQEAARTKDEFLAVLGHELRNPLAPISNALYLMDRKGDESTQTERAIIKRQLGHMTRLVDDLLDVSRITGKRLAMQMKPMQPGVLVQQAAQAVQPLLQGRRLAVDVAPAAAQAWISGDEVRLAQVLNNLLGNAVKFTAADGVIELMLRPADGAVEIEVRDDGQGMSAQVREHAFDLFFQAPQETDRARGGLGLGLAIVKSVVEMHGGSVRAASEGLGHGCSIVVRLPLTQPPAAATAAAPASTAGGGGKVLLVDDNQDAADTAAALLEACGWEVRVAYEPLRALDVLSQFEPGAALLDIGLPGMSGYELARRMRDSGYRGRLIAMTGYGRDADVAAALNASFDDHLTKPVPLDALLAALRDTPAPGAVNPPGN
jgi:signal transduction histidine kinase/ActR/RegA family two-component response regulator